MRLIEPSVEIISPMKREDVLPLLERIGRTCYKSEDRITDDSASKFVKMLAVRKHHAMLEHYSVSVLFICDRGVSHEIVRHRLASYAQESTRYCDYNKSKFDNQITCILPSWFKSFGAGEYMWRNHKKDCILRVIAPTEKDGCPFVTVSDFYKDSTWNHPEIKFIRQMLWTEDTYITLRKDGWKPEEARSVLVNAQKTEIVMTANLREWLHFFTMRDSPFAHPQMRQLASVLHDKFIKELPEIYDEY